MGKLYVVPTPIGNLDDMTFRAIKVLKKVDWIAAEDTRVTGKLLKRFEIETPMVTYEDYNEEAQVLSLMGKLKVGDVALVSDAGMPGISDPGYLLINRAIELGIEVIPLPGANAVLPAIVGSGFSTDRFVFLGFLPKKEGQKKKLLDQFIDDQKTLVIYESPYRLLDTLKSIQDCLGERKVCIAREISKRFEEFIRRDVSEAIKVFSENKVAGEVVVVIDGVTKKKEVWDEEKVIGRLHALTKQSTSLSKAAKQVAAESGWRKKEVYQLGLEKE